MYKSSRGQVKNLDAKSRIVFKGTSDMTPIVRPHLCFSFLGGVLAPATGANECSALGGKDLRDLDHGSDPSLPTLPPSFLPLTTTSREENWIQGT